MFVPLKVWLAWTGLLLCGLGTGSLIAPPPTRLTFLSVGQGDCAVFQHAGTTVLIDAGPQIKGFDAGDRVVVPRLAALGVRSVDLILLSHPDEDHIGGTGSVLRAYPSARVALSAEFRDHPLLRKRLQEWKVDPQQVLWLNPNALLIVGEFSFSLANPELDPGTDDNEGSTFIRFSNGMSSATFSGDASEAVETQMSNQGDWSAQVIHVGHHGSNSSTGHTWLREVRPRIAVVSCGRDNPYGHPHSNVLGRLEKAGARVLRTDRHGEIRLVPTQAGWTLER